MHQAVAHIRVLLDNATPYSSVLRPSTGFRCQIEPAAVVLSRSAYDTPEELPNTVRSEVAGVKNVTAIIAVTLERYHHLRFHRPMLALR
jgi:hypothetical protein